MKAVMTMKLEEVKMRLETSETKAVTAVSPNSDLFGADLVTVPVATVVKLVTLCSAAQTRLRFDLELEQGSAVHQEI